MADTQSDPTRSAQLPEQIASMQMQIEELYLARLALERDVLALRATQPVIMARPARHGLVRRMIRRLNPRAQRRYHLALIKGCGLFDEAWYLRAYTDVAEGGMDPAQHYLLHGATDLRNPGPYFDTSHYLHLYPDIVDNGMNPLVHYILSGIDESRSIRPGMPHGEQA